MGARRGPLVDVSLGASVLLAVRREAARVRRLGLDALELQLEEPALRPPGGRVSFDLDLGDGDGPLRATAAVATARVDRLALRGVVWPPGGRARVQRLLALRETLSARLAGTFDDDSRGAGLLDATDLAEESLVELPGEATWDDRDGAPDADPRGATSGPLLLVGGREAIRASPGRALRRAGIPAGIGRVAVPR
jgi:hypothetical protein